MDINGMWAFDVPEMNNKRLDAKGGVMEFIKAHITVAYLYGNRS